MPPQVAARLRGAGLTCQVLDEAAFRCVPLPLPLLLLLCGRAVIVHAVVVVLLPLLLFSAAGLA